MKTFNEFVAELDEAIDPTTFGISVLPTSILAGGLLGIYLADNSRKYKRILKALFSKISGKDRKLLKLLDALAKEDPKIASIMKTGLTPKGVFKRNQRYELEKILTRKGLEIQEVEDLLTRLKLHIKTTSVAEEEDL